MAGLWRVVKKCSSKVEHNNRGEISRIEGLARFGNAASIAQLRLSQRRVDGQRICVLDRERHWRIVILLRLRPH